MGRDPEKSAEIRIYCTPELKGRWEAWAAFHDDNPAALEALMDAKDEHEELVEDHPELKGSYFFD